MHDMEASDILEDPAFSSMSLRWPGKETPVKSWLGREMGRIMSIMGEIGCLLPGGLTEAAIVDEEMKRLLEAPSWTHPAEVLGEDHSPVTEMLKVCRWRWMNADDETGKRLETVIRRLVRIETDAPAPSLPTIRNERRRTAQLLHQLRAQSKTPTKRS